jgi:undecaprenyl-diphosphatase
MTSDRTVRDLTRASLVCGVAFALLAILVASGWSRLAALDERVSARWFAFTLEHRWCEALARAATFLGNGWTVTVLTGVVAVTLAVRGRWLLAWWLVLTVAGSAVVGTVVKVSIERTRPDSAGILTSAQGFAFPSGHTRSATVLCVAVVLVVGWQVLHPARRARVAILAVVTAVVGSVGLSRVFLGAHWPSDVLGGWLLGSALVSGSAVVLLRMTASDHRPADR